MKKKQKKSKHKNDDKKMEIMKKNIALRLILTKYQNYKTTCRIRVQKIKHSSRPCSARAAHNKEIDHKTGL